MSDRLAPAAARVEHVRRDFRGDCGCTVRLLALADSLADTIAAVRGLLDDQPAPVVTIARGPLDYQPEAAITLATVDTPESRAWREDGGRS
jgi:hypothetical protein